MRTISYKIWMLLWCVAAWSADTPSPQTATRKSARPFTDHWLQQDMQSGASDAAGRQLLDDLGIAVQVTGAPDVDQRHDMGVTGSRTAGAASIAPQHIGSSADRLAQTAREAAASNPAYQTLHRALAPQQGYNQTTAYLNSLQQGRDAGLADCLQNLSDTLATGEYRACQGQQSGTLYDQCKVTRSCVQYQTTTTHRSTTRDCQLTARPKTVACVQRPLVRIHRKRIAYPNCQTLLITQGAAQLCPTGYREVVATDMVRDVKWDDVRLCTQAAGIGAARCDAGAYYLLTRTRSPLYQNRATVPKGFHARLELSHVYAAPVAVTLDNETTHTRLIDHQPLADGAVIELPYTTDQAQTFRFSLDRTAYQPHGTGVLVLWIAHYREQTQVSHSQQEHCTIPLPAQGCRLTGTRCLAGGETRYIEGVPVYQDCWQRQHTYQCPDWQAVDNDCHDIPACHAAGKPVQSDPWHQTLSMTCEQHETQRVCQQWQTQRHCRQQPIDYLQEQQHFTSEPVNNFDLAMQHIGLLTALQQSLVDDPLQVFRGEAMICRKSLMPFGSNCCDPKVAAPHSNNSKHHASDGRPNPCTLAEQKLAAATRVGLVHQVGSWCAKRYAWPMDHTCREQRHSACRFDSLMGRLIQEQGRAQINARARHADTTRTQTVNWPLFSDPPAWHNTTLGRVTVAAYAAPPPANSDSSQTDKPLVTFAVCDRSEPEKRQGCGALPVLSAAPDATGQPAQRNTRWLLFESPAGIADFQFVTPRLAIRGDCQAPPDAGTGPYCRWHLAVVTAESVSTVVTVPVQWVLARHEKTSPVIHTPLNILLRPYQPPAASNTLQQTPQSVFWLDYRLPEEAQWHTYPAAIPTSVPETAAVTLQQHPLLQWYGHCQQTGGACRFYLRAIVPFRPVPWGNGDQPNCQGLTTEDLMLIDFAKIDFTEWLQQQAKTKHARQPGQPDLSRINGENPDHAA